MDAPNAIAEIQSNPHSIPAYRCLAAYYDKLGLKNEAEAFRALIEVKLHGSNSSDHREKRQSNESQGVGIGETDCIRDIDR